MRCDAATVTLRVPPPLSATEVSEGRQGDSDCFISAAYGSPLAPPVQLLREFRDTYLKPSGIGRWLLTQYRRLSPPLAEAIRSQSGVRVPIRMALTPLVWGVQGWTYSQQHPWHAALLGLLAVGSLGGVVLRWRRHAHASLRSALSGSIGRKADRGTSPS